MLRTEVSRPCLLVLMLIGRVSETPPRNHHGNYVDIAHMLVLLGMVTLTWFEPFSFATSWHYSVTSGVVYFATLICWSGLTLVTWFTCSPAELPIEDLWYDLWSVAFDVLLSLLLTWLDRKSFSSSTVSVS